MPYLTLVAKQDHLEKAAVTRDPVKAVAEFVWNALDADALNVSVSYNTNPMGGIQSIEIIDDGSGIPPDKADSEFKKLGGSWKKAITKTAKFQRPVHGKEGRGRLRFFSLAENARWISHFDVPDIGRQMQTLEIKASDLEKCFVSDPSISNSRNTGTKLVLDNLRGTFDNLTSVASNAQFGSAFAPYLMQFPDITLTYNGQRIDPKSNVAHERDYEFDSITVGDRSVGDLKLRVIEWHSGTGERKIHFGGEAGITLGSQPANVVAPDFDFSAYAYSSYFQELANANLLELDDLTEPLFKATIEAVRDKLTDHFRRRQSDRTKGLIDQLKIEGAYPYDGEPTNEIERREREVFDIATHTVSSYSKDFKRAETSLKKTILTLIREALRHNPESLTNILHEVVKLPKARQDELSGLMQRTELGNIIAASSLIADRLVTIEILKGIVFNPKYRETVRERGELDALIKDNTWMFGENFHITLPEAGLTKIMNRVSEERSRRPAKGSVRKPDGKIGRVDCFLGRAIPHANPDKREFLLIELKRPSLKVSRKEFDQVEEYSKAIRLQPDFAHTDTSWTFILVSGEIDDNMMDRVTQDNRPVGLWIDKNNQKVWVRTWAEIIRECEGRLRFIKDKLNLEVSDDEINRRINDLRKKIVKDDNYEDVS
jgi:Histidine kinase-, DNA gyrase B-, and HSP90-like ATPase